MMAIRERQLLDVMQIDLGQGKMFQLRASFQEGGKRPGVMQASKSDIGERQVAQLSKRRDSQKHVQVP
jgi:hypothetical protein